MINLGEKVKDKLTAFAGTAVAKAQYLYGCEWIAVVPYDLQDGKPVQELWFDAERLETIKEDEINSEKVKPFLGSVKGGPNISMPSPGPKFNPSKLDGYA